MPSVVVDEQDKPPGKRPLTFLRGVRDGCLRRISHGRAVVAVGWRVGGFRRRLRARIPDADFTLESAPQTVDHIASALNLSDDKKVDVLTSMLTVLHGNIVAWATRAHEAITWAVGITFGVVSYVFISPQPVMLSSAIVISIGLLLFGLMIHLYVRTARRAHSGNRLAISKCEAALRLYEKGAYLTPQAFFLYSTTMQTSQTLRVLSMIHVAATLAAVIFIVGRALVR
jgi:hypothetical protein